MFTDLYFKAKMEEEFPEEYQRTKNIFAIVLFVIAMFIFAWFLLVLFVL